MSLDPQKWMPIESEPITPGTPTIVLPPPVRTINPYLRTTLPANQQLQPDMVRQQYTSTIPQIRVK